MLGLVVSFLEGGEGVYITIVRIASPLLKVNGRDEVIWMFGIMVNDVCTLFSVAVEPIDRRAVWSIEQ